MKISNCRLCKNGKLSEPILDFEKTPLANEFLYTREKQDIFPLQVCVCLTCGHYQLNEGIDPERLFRHYVFVAGTSSVNVKHFADYANYVLNKFKLAPGSKILDIASNDGTLLKEFKKFGLSVLGIDPAKNIADEANKNGIETIPEFFTNKYADHIIDRYGKFDFITANNVFAHVPDLEDFAKGVKKVLSPKGIFSFEVSYFMDVINNTLFDTVYHEHSSYHTVKPLISFFENLGMDLFYVQQISNHGGSIRVFVKHSTPTAPWLYEFERKSTIPDLLLKENDIERKVKDLKRDIQILGLRLREKIRDIKSQNKSIAIYGTPAKATTLMYALGIDAKWIDFAVDDNPLKQGTATPGNHIDIFHRDEIYKRQPDYLLVLAWNFADSIIQNNKEFKGKWIIPLPSLKEV